MRDGQRGRCGCGQPAAYLALADEAPGEVIGWWTCTEGHRTPVRRPHRHWLTYSGWTCVGTTVPCEISGAA